MGVVYCALDSMLNRRVAIKVMSDAIAQDTDLRERFLREAQAAGSLQHPNVVTVYDFGEVDGHLYIAMEYVEGEDLEDLLRSKIPLPLEAKLELIIGVLQGLAFAHKRGVIHRDIKPANIRVDGEGKARIMDFGVAHLASSDMTRTGTMLGTPSYMAPEQIVGGPVGPETDIFSIGAVLYELLTNTRPFKGDTLQTLMYQILSTTPPPLDTVAPELPADLNRIVMRALQKEPKDRYARALEMADDLSMVKTTKNHDGTSSSLSLRATIDSALAQRYAGARRVARRRQLTSIVSGAVGTVVLLGAVYFIVQINGGSESDAPASLVSASEAGTISDSGGTTPGSTTTPPPVDSTTTVSRVARETTTPPTSGAPPAAPAPPPTRSSGPTAQELLLARNVQVSALDARRRARDAGATLDQLRAGDGHNTSGETLLARGRTVDAANAFNRATAAWVTAERTAREDARRAEAARIAAQPEVAPPVVVAPPSSPPVARPVDTQVTKSLAAPGENIASPPSPPPRTAANSAAAINAVVATYARAIESRDIAELRRAYPGMSADQRRAFEDFFRATRSLNASLAVSGLEVTGTTAEARLTGTYAYVTTGGDTESRPVSFRATLAYESGAWTLMTVR